MLKKEYKIKLNEGQIQRLREIASHVGKSVGDTKTEIDAFTWSLHAYLNCLSLDADECMSGEQNARMATLRRRLARTMHRFGHASNVMKFVSHMEEVGAIDSTIASAIAFDLYFLDNRLYRDCKNYAH